MYQKVFVTLISLSLIFYSCSIKEQKLTKEESRTFSATLEKDVRDMKIDFIEKNIIMPVLIERMYAGGKLKPSKEIEAGIRQMLQNNQYEKSIYETLSAKGNFSMVKQYEKGGRQHIIYRVRGDGFTYLDIELTRFKKKVGIADILFYSTGQTISESMAELGQKLVAHMSGDMAASITTRFNTIGKYIKNTDYASAKKEFDLLPYDIRNNRLYEFRYLEILSKLDPGEYHAFQKQFESKYAHDASIQLMLVDIYLAQEEWDKALNSINQVDSLINKDPFLDYQRGLILNMKGDEKTAVVHFEQYAKADSRFAEVYPELVVSFANQGDLTTAGKYFTTYKKLRTADKEVITYLRESYPGIE